MRKIYTKQQIVEAIKHWKSVLKRMDESKSPLLDEFAKVFGEDAVFSNKPFTLTNEFAIKMAKIINNILFDSMIADFPEIKVVTYGQFCKKHKIL